LTLTEAELQSQVSGLSQGASSSNENNSTAHSSQSYESAFTFQYPLPGSDLLPDLHSASSDLNRRDSGVDQDTGDQQNVYSSTEVADLSHYFQPSNTPFTSTQAPAISDAFSNSSNAMHVQGQSDLMLDPSKMQQYFPNSNVQFIPPQALNTVQPSSLTTSFITTSAIGNAQTYFQPSNSLFFPSQASETGDQPIASTSTPIRGQNTMEPTQGAVDLQQYLPPTNSQLISGPSTTHPPIASQSSNPRPLQAPDETFAFDYGLLDRIMMNLSSDLNTSATFDQSEPSTTYVPVESITAEPQDSRTVVDQTTPLQDFSRQSPSSISRILHGQDKPFHAPSVFSLTDLGFSRVIDASADAGNDALVGGWYDADDVPTAVRNHLQVSMLYSYCNMTVI
jgi:hypothetical protein